LKVQFCEAGLGGKAVEGMARRIFSEQDAIRYGLGIFAAFAALYLRHLLDPLLGVTNPYHAAWLAVVFTAWYCGLGPSILATLIEAVGVWYWFVPSLHSVSGLDRSRVSALAGFVIFSAGIVALGESNRRGTSSRARLAAIVDSSNDAIISKNLNGIITSWNRSAERIFGWDESEALGRPITILIPPELLHEEVEIMKKLRAGQRIEHFETVRITKAGRRFNVSVTISPVKDIRGRIVGASKIARDVTELKEIEAASRINEERIRAAFSQTYSFLIFMTKDGTITEANRAAIEGCGFTRVDVIGRKFWEPWWSALPDEAQKLQQSVARAAGGEIVREECHYCLRDRSVLLYADFTVSPVRDETGRVVMLVASGIDMTEQKALRDQLEQRVQARTYELERSNTSLRELSGRLLQMQDDERRRIARELHDSIGQLLAALSMNIATVALEKHKLTTVAQSCIEENEGLVMRVSDEIRTLSYLLHPPLLDEIGLESALKDYVDGFGKRSKIAVELEMPRDFGRLSKEAEIALFRVVQECLTNIHRHSGSATAAIRISRQNGIVSLEVKDDGKGIPAEKLVQVNASGTVGVGFRGMRERLRQLGGSLEVRSDEKGTIVAATLQSQHSNGSAAKLAN
jgi:PAS domain S-box-containing protein